MSVPTAPVESFDEFYSEVKEIEKRDSVLTPKQQIDRLLRPGSTYFNLNPFEVLQLEPETALDEIKKKYRRLSILVHPDKNMEDAERAQQAFEIVNRAWKTLENDDTRKKCLDIYQEAKERTEHMIEQKKKKQKKESRQAEGIPEDDPVKFKHAVYVMTMKVNGKYPKLSEVQFHGHLKSKAKLASKKLDVLNRSRQYFNPAHRLQLYKAQLFADMERKRQHLETRDQEERKRKREAEIEQEEQLSMEKEWAKNFEESRQNRVESWKTFQSGSGGEKKKKKHKMMSFKPPKPKPESR